jgi:polyhydroxybutyrate depolymerase
MGGDVAQHLGKAPQATPAQVGRLGSGRHRRRLGVLLAAALAVGAVACTGDDDSGGEGDAASGESTTTAPADCTPARAFDGSGVEQTLSFDGQERHYVVTLPDDYDGTDALPLVFGFHGWGGSKEVVAEDWQLPQIGAERGYAVVTPDALPGGPGNAPGTPLEWNMFGLEDRVDDYTFVYELLADLTEQLCIDESRVYAMGHSNGSSFTGFVKCVEPRPFAAVAMVSAFIPPTCAADEASPSVLAVHGTADPGVPYDGGAVANSTVQIPPVRDTLQDYVDAYQCPDPPTEDELAPQVERISYEGCVDDAEVALYTVVDGDHEWPGSDLAVGGGADWSATEAILDFFDRHTLPS